MSNIHSIVDNLHLEDLQNETHPSIFDENDNYDMLILRLPLILDELKMTSIGFIITSKESYLYNRDEKKFETLQSRFEAPYKILDGMIDELLKSFEKYIDSIADIEEALYLNKTKNSFMNKWLHLKRNIVRIERVLMHASSTMDGAIKHYEKDDDFPINHYIDLHGHIERVLRSASLQLSKLDYLYTFYSARTNEKMNTLIYNLTIISAIFLPLNLIVGFFGMNTSGLPFTEGTSGTTGVMILTLFLFFITAGIIGFIRKRF
ncbi:MAG: CorA family divalent cation transporter [Sulfurimonas sp.]|uniref:CorA family divalent cation transporter n=1 Tax=Sulfurimonas sp. TaxID=2022749 RepID=UPI0025F471DC|nr:CorA family divalent cation transporter [Sulfurimonas sp.]MCK9455002.1 magnesium transporter [Sulfurimonas sp.]